MTGVVRYWVDNRKMGVFYDFKVIFLLVVDDTLSVIVMRSCDMQFRYMYLTGNLCAWSIWGDFGRNPRWTQKPPKATLWASNVPLFCLIQHSKFIHNVYKPLAHHPHHPLRTSHHIWWRKRHLKQKSWSFSYLPTTWLWSFSSQLTYSIWHIEPWQKLQTFAGLRTSVALSFLKSVFRPLFDPITSKAKNLVLHDARYYAKILNLTLLVLTVLR